VLRHRWQVSTPTRSIPGIAVSTWGAAGIRQKGITA
jgi:hypothetical protein